MPIRQTFFTVALALSLLTTVHAQDQYLTAIYGQGVHTFHRGNMRGASQLFNDAIGGGLEDPRAYYFRAITKMRSGDIGGAQSDIRMGANLEVSGAGSFNVGRALERVQGPARIRFEVARRTSLLDAHRAQAAMNRQRTMVPPVSAPPVQDLLRQPVSPERTNIEDLNIPPAAPGEDNPFEAPNDEELIEPADDGMDDEGMLDENDPFVDDGVPADDDELLGDDDELLSGEEDMLDDAEVDEEDDNIFGDDPDDALDGFDEPTDETDALFGE